MASLYAPVMELRKLSSVLETCARERSLEPLYGEFPNSGRPMPETITALCIQTLKKFTPYNPREIERFQVRFKLVFQKRWTTGDELTFYRIVEKACKDLLPNQNEQKTTVDVDQKKQVLHQLRKEVTDLSATWEGDAKRLLQQLLPKQFHSPSQKSSYLQLILSTLQLEAKFFRLVDADLSCFFANEALNEKISSTANVSTIKAPNSTSVWEFNLPNLIDEIDQLDPEAFAILMIGYNLLFWKVGDQLKDDLHFNVPLAKRFLTLLRSLGSKSSFRSLSSLHSFLYSRITLLQHKKAQNAFMEQYKHWCFAEIAFKRQLTYRQFVSLRAAGRRGAELKEGFETLEIKRNEEIPALLLPSNKLFRQFQQFRLKFFSSCILNILDKLRPFDDEKLLCKQEKRAVQAYRDREVLWQSLYQEGWRQLQEVLADQPTSDSFLDLSGNGRECLPDQLFSAPPQEPESPEDYLTRLIEKWEKNSQSPPAIHMPRPDRKKKKSKNKKEFALPQLRRQEEEKKSAPVTEPSVIPESLPGTPPLFTYHPRVTRWFECDQHLDPHIFPEYQEHTPRHQRRMIELHGLSPLVDRFSQIGFETKWQKEDGKKHRLLLAAAEIQREGEIERGVMSWAINPENNSCYHRFFHRVERTDELIQKMVSKTFEANDFPELTQETLASSRENQSFQAEDGGAITINGLGTIEIQDRRLGITIRLYPTKMES